MLRLGDVLKEDLYGYLPGNPEPVLLMAAGQRIDSVSQLRRLREGGYAVDLPEVNLAAEGLSQRASIPQAEFRGRLDSARRVHQLVVDSARELICRVREGACPDRAVLDRTSQVLTDEVLADPSTFAALTYLQPCEDYTIEHCANVGILMAAMGHILEMPEEECRILTMAGLLHDVGKQRVPLKTLNKPGPLTNEEFAQIWRHPLHGADILADWPGCPPVVREVALQHHERLNGVGYPFGLSGEMLPMASRIAAVADTFDAMTANRVYHRNVSAREAILEVFGARERLFDGQCVKALIRLIGVYPVGTRVMLNTGQSGLVVAPNPQNSARPTVLVDRDPSGEPLPHPYAVSFRTDAYRILGAAR